MKLLKKNKKIKKSIGRNLFFKKNNYLIIRNIITECLNKNKGELIGVCDESGTQFLLRFSYHHSIIKLCFLILPYQTQKKVTQ